MKTLNLIVVIFLSLLLLSCSRSLPPFSIEILLSQEPLQGTIWWNLEIKKSSTSEKNIGQADFQVSENFMYLRLKTPIGTTLGFLVWKKEDPSLIKVYDLYNQELIILFLKDPYFLKDLELLPFYFLGVKENTLDRSFERISIGYRFDKRKKIGTIITKDATFVWQIQNIAPLKEKTWEALFDFEALEKQLIKRSIPL